MSDSEFSPPPRLAALTKEEVKEALKEIRELRRDHSAAALGLLPVLVGFAISFGALLSKAHAIDARSPDPDHHTLSNPLTDATVCSLALAAVALVLQMALVSDAVLWSRKPERWSSFVGWRYRFLSISKLLVWAAVIGCVASAACLVYVALVVLAAKG